MRLLLDLNLSPLVVDALRQRGYDAIRVTDVLDARAPDVEVVSKARELDAIVVTRDQDVGAIVAGSGATHPSVVNLRVVEVDARRLAQRIAAVVAAAETELSAGAIVTVDDTRVRIHRLPVGG